MRTLRVEVEGAFRTETGRVIETRRETLSVEIPETAEESWLPFRLRAIYKDQMYTKVVELPTGPHVLDSVKLSTAFTVRPARVEERQIGRDGNGDLAFVRTLTYL